MVMIYQGLSNVLSPQGPFIERFQWVCFGQNHLHQLWRVTRLTGVSEILLVDHKWKLLFSDKKVAVQAAEKLLPPRYLAGRNWRPEEVV